MKGARRGFAVVHVRGGRFSPSDDADVHKAGAARPFPPPHAKGRALPRAAALREAQAVTRQLREELGKTGGVATSGGLQLVQA